MFSYKAQDGLDVNFTVFRAASFLGEPRKALLEVFSPRICVPRLSIEVLHRMNFGGDEITGAKTIPGKMSLYQSYGFSSERDRPCSRKES